MNELNKKKEKSKFKESNRQFGILLKISLIIGIIVVSGFIIYYLLKPEPGYVTLGILNEDEKAENYPTEGTVNETISFYVTVGNYMNKDFSFQVMIKKGNNQTSMYPDIPSNGLIDSTIGDFTLNHNENWASEQISISFPQLGENQIIIVELWQIKSETEEFYSNAWMRLNITN